MERRELPTHLHVEDKLIAGLTIRQVLFLCVGVSVGYSLWLHLAGVATAIATWLAHTPSLAMVAPLAQVARLVVSALPILLMVICVLVRPADRPLEDWLLVVLRYVSLPKAAVWRTSAQVATLQENTTNARGSHLPSSIPNREQGERDAEDDWDDQKEWSTVQDARDSDPENTPGASISVGDDERRARHMQGGW